ncbi:MAG: Rne/Rng family ribonuclease [Alphaproteobacteria bacterium]|nr:Rne/Rng family ribonuclease [Alphaproteobacteria bacterium]
MTKRMLIDATHPEETRVAVISGNKLEEYDYETVVRKQLKGNIYLVKVTRVEPSLQAAFVDFGGNRHGFLPFPEIHPDYYRIPIADREALLAEERALAAEQAAREDAEDEAELAAQGQSLEDLDDEDDEEEEDAEAAEAEEPAEPIEEVAARSGASIAEEIAQVVVTDDGEDDEEEDEEEEETSEAEDDDEDEGEEETAEVISITPAADEDDEDDEEDEDEDDEEFDELDEDDDEDDEDDEDEEEDEDEDEEESEASAENAEEGEDGEKKSRGRGRRGRGGRNKGRRGGKKTRVETVGGDIVETPVFRSSIKRRYKIQEVIKRNQIMLIQISKEERGNKGAAVTSYISLPGRYCVLMPNSPRGGGVSRKVSNAKDRQRLKKILQELNVPEGMSVILRTAGVSRSKAEIKRDLDYLLRLWDQIRELTLKSTAPALIYEEGNLIKRAIRDLYRRDIDEVHVAGEEAYKSATEFMRTLMPSHAKRVQEYKDDNIPLFFRYQVENQIDEIHSPTVHLKSGGYIVINPTEAMVSIDVNSGRATKGRHIEETALKTNLEASDEIARQLRLRDQGGLVVIDFIDMEDRRNNRAVERRMRDAMASDRARIQLGRISAFGLMELSRQRLHPSLVETNFEVCTHCGGSGLVRTVETTGVIVLRALEEEGLRGRAAELRVSVPPEIALYIFNNKRDMLTAIEKRYNIRVFVHADEDLIKPNYKLEVTRGTGAQRDNRPQRPAPVKTVDMSDLPELSDEDISDDSTVSEDEAREARGRGNDGDDESGGRDRNDRNGRRRGRRGGRNRSRGRGRDRDDDNAPQNESEGSEDGNRQPRESRGEGDDERGGRRRGRRGGRRRGRGRGRGRDGEGNGDGNGDHHAASETPQSQGGSEASSQSQSHHNENSSPRAESGSHGHDDHGAHGGGGSEMAAAVGDDSGGDGKSRKGWWKRLTE